MLKAKDRDFIVCAKAIGNFGENQIGFSDKPGAALSGSHWLGHDRDLNCARLLTTLSST
jgi:hypothetical protein